LAEVTAVTASLDEAKFGSIRMGTNFARPHQHEDIDVAEHTPRPIFPRQAFDFLERRR
jgi:hypothetical protein